MIDSALVAGAGRLLPAEERDWAKAMLAELEVIPAGRARRRFALGCARAIVTKAIVARARGWLGQPAWLLSALAVGFGIALFDRRSDGRTAMWLLLSAGSGIFGWCRPAAAWRWGVLLGAGIPLLAMAGPPGGPYGFDRADALYGLPVALGLASLAGFCRRHLGPAVRALALLAVFAGGCVVGAGAQQARPHQLTAADLEAFASAAFAEYLQLSPEASLAFVVVKDDSIRFASGYGTEASGGPAVDPEQTVFWLASLTKLVTADAVLRELARGHLSLEDPASRHLGWRLPTCRGCREITIKDLLTHTSGLDEPFMAGTVDDSSDLSPLSAYLSRVRWRTSNPPGEILRYSNHALALAGLMVERVSGTPYAEYVEREILAPLGMARSTVQQPIRRELAARLATAGTDARIDFLQIAPAGSLVGTAADMGRFLIGQLDSGSRSESLSLMHTTQWRAHPGVPGAGLGWFETNLGGVSGLYHTGARHHFSVAWIAPAHRTGVFLVHSMRQGGRFQHLRTAVIRNFVERYLPPDSTVIPSGTSTAPGGVYRPMMLSTTTVERLGYLLLDTRVRAEPDGRLVIHAPGSLGTIAAQPSGGGLFEVRDGPQAGLRLGVVEQNGSARLALGGALLDPVIFTRLSWWQRGRVHAVLLGAGSVALVLAAMGHGMRVLFPRRQAPSPSHHRVWKVVTGAGLALLLALIAAVLVVVTTPEAGAAAHMRAGLRIVLTLLTTAAILGVAIPVLVLADGWRGRAGPARLAVLSLLSLAGLLVAGLLWHYRLVGFRL